VSGTCYGLSVTKGYTVLATLYNTGRIQEYTTHVSLIKEINFNDSIGRPYHCV